MHYGGPSKAAISVVFLCESQGKVDDGAAASILRNNLVAGCFVQETQ
jgi:hypothetical protein